MKKIFEKIISALGTIALVLLSLVAAVVLFVGSLFSKTKLKDIGEPPQRRANP